MQAQLKVPWLPKGVMKAWALRVVSLGTRIAAWLCTALKCVSLPIVLTHGHLLRRYTFRRLACYK